MGVRKSNGQRWALFLPFLGGIYTVRTEFRLPPGSLKLRVQISGIPWLLQGTGIRECDNLEIECRIPTHPSPNPVTVSKSSQGLKKLIFGDCSSFSCFRKTFPFSFSKSSSNEETLYPEVNKMSARYIIWNLGSN